MGLFRFVGLFGARPRELCVHSGAPWGSLGSFGCAMWVVGYILIRWVYSGSPWTSSRSFGFIRERPGDHWDYSGSLGSLMNAQGVVGFNRVRWVHSGEP